MDLFSNHALSVVLFTPLLGALVVACLPRGNTFLPRAVGIAFGALGFLVSLPLWFRFPENSPSFAFKESATWIPSIGARYALGVDGISMLFVVLTTFVGMLAIVFSWNTVQDRTKEFYVLILLLQTGILGVFVSMDLFLLFVFWEVTLVPMYFLISVWGGERRLYAALKFFLFTLAGTAIMLLAIVALYFNASRQTGMETFDIGSLLASAQLFPDSLKTYLFWGFFFAFAILTPLFPFHTWLADTTAQAPVACSAILAGVMLKLGTYGFLRVSLPLLPRDPQARAHAVHIVVALALIGAIYGAVASLTQRDFRRLLSYSCVSQMGFCTLGIFALTPLGLTGSVSLQIVHGVLASALFFSAGILYARRQTGRVAEFGGLAAPMPGFAALYVVITLGVIGMPLLGGFIGDFTTVQGVFEANRAWAAWAVFGLVLLAASLMWLFQRVMLGDVTNEANKAARDIGLREYAVLLPLVATSFWIGIYPRPFFALIERPVERIIQQVNPGYFQHGVSSNVQPVARVTPVSIAEVR